ncbi:MAG: bifunctional phosphopantothenoylcysteine decarboxylase/phosphopantothenate--cysteine ligase CoaBC [Desulfosarcinaceae bacterium]|nr:bifunctional phosphopantothenoylcysteine decarboxylase/phosphopantothenate--cysteine ligase CoaBC [Desulfosarcinaceae bacterium]
MRRGLAGKQIVVGVSGGIAAYKTVEVVRLLTKAEAAVRVMMTQHACEFIQPLTFEALCGQKVCSSLFNADDEAAMQHIDWAREADGIVLAPATANLVAKLAHGLADDALSTFMLAVAAPVLVCPAMNTQMYENRAVQRNLQILAADGHSIMMPGAGPLACGETGYGRLREPWEIVDRLTALLTPKDLVGKRVLVSAGPTREAIDPVRFISNPSSGKMGYAIARAAELRGAEVTLVSGPTHLAAPLGLETIPVTSAADMYAEVVGRFDTADIVIKTAAVGDYRPTHPAGHKMKKTDGGDAPTLNLTRTEDILAALGRRKQGQILVGFAAETRDLRENAGQKLAAKHLDLIVGNLIGPPDSGFGSDTNRVSLLFADGREERLGVMSKEALAHELLDRIAALAAPSASDG